MAAWHGNETTRKGDPQDPHERRRLFAGRLWVVAAALLWSTSGLFAKSPWFVDWPAADRGPMLAFWRALFASLILLPFVRRPRWRPSLVPLGLSFAAMSVLYMTSMALTTAANAIWLQNIAPAWVFLLGITIFGDSVDRRNFVPLGFSLAGVGLILVHEAGGQAIIGVVCGLASGLAFALVALLMRRTADEDHAWIVAFNQGVVAVLLLPWIVCCTPMPSGAQLVVTAAFGTLQMALPYLCFVRGLRLISSQEATLIVLLEPVLLPLWVYLAWGEAPRWWTLAGGCLIFCGLTLRYAWLEFRKASPPLPPP